MGFHQAGFEVVGIDKDPQPNYPFEFHQGKVGRLKLKWIRANFDAIVGGPPCQLYSTTRTLHTVEYPDLVEPTRSLMKRTGLPYVIENVPGAPLLDPVQLCGSSFGLRVRRHRLFETNWLLPGLKCAHGWQDRSRIYRRRVSKSRGGEIETGVVSVHGGGQMIGVNQVFAASVAMGIDWMTKDELNEAIPPAYTRYIGKFLKEVV